MYHPLALLLGRTVEEFLSPMDCEWRADTCHLHSHHHLVRSWNAFWGILKIRVYSFRGGLQAEKKQTVRTQVNVPLTHAASTRATGASPACKDQDIQRNENKTWNEDWTQTTDHRQTREKNLRAGPARTTGGSVFLNMWNSVDTAVPIQTCPVHRCNHKVRWAPSEHTSHHQPDPVVWFCRNEIQTLVKISRKFLRLCSLLGSVFNFDIA